MSKARVKGDKTSFIGNSKMSINCCPYRAVKSFVVSQRIASQRAVAECRVHMSGHASLMFAECSC